MSQNGTQQRVRNAKRRNAGKQQAHRDRAAVSAHWKRRTGRVWPNLLEAAAPPRQEPGCAAWGRMSPGVIVEAWEGLWVALSDRCMRETHA